MAADAGRDWHAILRAAADGELDVLFLIGVDPLADVPDADLARRALDNVPVKVVHFWDGLGFYRWDIEQLGDCTRKIDPGSPGSYEKSQECGAFTLFDREQGFECSRRPFRTLLKVCPFMARQ